jgi:hypothetical protein
LPPVHAISGRGRLDDPWYDAVFIAESTAKGHRYIDTLEGADGVFFWCPCGWARPEFPLDGGRPHGVIVSFANPRGCSPAASDAGSQSRSGGPSRWTVTGTGLADLTLSPSIAVGTAEAECWHGFVTNGLVT